MELRVARKSCKTGRETLQEPKENWGSSDREGQNLKDQDTKWNVTNKDKY